MFDRGQAGMFLSRMKYNYLSHLGKHTMGKLSSQQKSYYLLFREKNFRLDFLQLPDSGIVYGEQNRGKCTTRETFCQHNKYYLLFHQLFFRLDIVLNSDSGGKTRAKNNLVKTREVFPLVFKCYEIA